MARWLLLLSTCIAVQAVLWWSLGRAQEPGFVSIDCGSDATTTYTDDNKIQWVGDSSLIKEGRAVAISGGTMRVLSTMRLFDGNQSKYCYSLTAVTAGAFYMVRGSFWPGITPPYTPQNPDGKFRFKLIVDADVWHDIEVPYGSLTWQIRDIYVRAQRSSINACFARSQPGGDAPFISALELRPLPSTLTSTIVMLNFSRICVPALHGDYGVLSTSPSFTRYPDDPLDRYWSSFTASPPQAVTTASAISTSAQRDDVPATILQTTFTSTYITVNFSALNPDVIYIAEFYFAEIDPAVNASGQRVFNILMNGEVQTTTPIDVFAAVGANAAYGYPLVAVPNAAGVAAFNFTAAATSLFQPYVAAAEFFATAPSTALTDADAESAVDGIKTSLNLNSYKGDPCLPIGFGYEWLNCTQDPNITAISLSNYGTRGEIPEALNNLTLLTEIHLDGNGLQGVIPDLSALTNLQVLVLSNNELSGPIPDYLATLKNLKVLDLQNNNLSGVIPAALLQRKEASTLNFQFSGNPLCESNSGLNCTSSPTPSSTPSNAPPSSTAKKGNSGVIVGVAVAVVLLVGIGIGIAVYCFCKKRTPSSLDQPINKHQASPEQELPQVYQSPGPVINKVIPKLSVEEFTFQAIKVATNNFSTQLGMGGFGPVYKGRLQDGRFVAIKVASNSSHQGSKEFLNEVDLLSRVHHKNLVGLLGYCNEEKLVLVYEFMSNGSLFDCLHGPYAKASPLLWGTRLRILVDAAQGLDYLHYGCNPRIIHRDVKSSNILLNDQLKAKISDFGISRNSFVNETGAAPTALMGSMGYMDPEYLSTMKLTEKVDVYSFGVLLFEVVCGRTAVFTDSSKQQTHIAEWAKASIDRGVIDEIVDASLQRQYDVSSVWKVLEIALACVTFSSAQRPEMSAVFLELKEAERMELESDQRNVFDKPSLEFAGGNTLSFTHVNAR